MARDPRTAKRTPPAFQLYAGDWLSSTLGMPREIKGLYIDLLCWSWLNGPLPDDPAWRFRMIGGSKIAAAALWKTMRRHWKKTAHGWINPRLERQRAIQEAWSIRGKTAAAARWRNAQASPMHASTQAGKHARSIEEALAEAMPRAWPSSSSSSSSSEDLNRQLPLPGFSVFAAIASDVIAELQTNDLGEIAEAFKRRCAAQQLQPGARLTQKAIDAALHARAKKRRA
jgi:uncharacterized protein YdaU (DUF1376 family)